MKIGHNLYLCPWCNTKINHQRASASGGNNPNKSMLGRHTVTSTLICPKCGRDVSQRTRDGGR